jgi:Ca2+-binding EF-hand superfamily protein
MWWNVGPHLKRRMAVERSTKRGTNSYYLNLNGIDELRQILIGKFGTLTRAWRTALDTRDQGIIDCREFCDAMSKISFVGNLRSLWNNMDLDQSGFISLSELDKEGSEALEKFRARCVLKFGSMQAAWDNCLDINKSGGMSLGEMKAAAKDLGYQSTREVAYLFSLLQATPGSFAIQAHDILFLQKWEDRKQKAISRSWRIKSKWVNHDPYFHLDTEIAEHETGLVQKRKSITEVVFKSNSMARTPRGATPSPVPFARGAAGSRSPSPSRQQQRGSVNWIGAVEPAADGKTSPIQKARKSFVAKVVVKDDAEDGQDLELMRMASGTPQRASSASKDSAARTDKEKRRRSSVKPEVHTTLLLSANVKPFGRTHEAETEGPKVKPRLTARFMQDAGLEPPRLNQPPQNYVDDESVNSSVFTDVVLMDQSKAWEAFRAFLVDKYGSLPRAFDIIDSSGDGLLIRNEFLEIVTRKHRYCRASEALRLFDSAIELDEQSAVLNGNISWTSFGITLDEWKSYLKSKQLQKQAHFVQRQNIFRGLRGEMAKEDHNKRMQCPGTKPMAAFWTPLMKGWGFPPSYEPPPEVGTFHKLM